MSLVYLFRNGNSACGFFESFPFQSSFLFYCPNDRNSDESQNGSEGKKIYQGKQKILKEACKFAETVGEGAKQTVPEGLCLMSHDGNLIELVPFFLSKRRVLETF